ncbi:MAG: Stp1/IreP family PP2C-type Ser/Thr phosphatase [Clostridia bacterium]
MRYASSTCKGKIRKKNEDSYAVIRGENGEFHVFAVADGMGGHEYGDLASLIASTSLKEYITGNPTKIVDLDSFTAYFSIALDTINRKIIAEGIFKNLPFGMGTTLSLVLVSGSMLYIAHIGDSRIYIRRRDGFLRLTRDHSYVEELVEQGMITEDEARTHPKKNVITRVLGVDEELLADYGQLELNQGDRLLICTDGLTNVVEDGILSEVMDNSADPRSCVRELVRRANALGSPDNITVIAIYTDENDGGY